MSRPTISEVKRGLRETPGYILALLLISMVGLIMSGITLSYHLFTDDEQKSFNSAIERLIQAIYNQTTTNTRINHEQLHIANTSFMMQKDRQGEHKQLYDFLSNKIDRNLQHIDNFTTQLALNPQTTKEEQEESFRDMKLILQNQNKIISLFNSVLNNSRGGNIIANDQNASNDISR